MSDLLRVYFDPSEIGRDGYPHVWHSESEAAVQKEWAALQKAHPQLLGSLSLMIERVDKAETVIFYRLQAGPLADKKAAGQLCGSLKQQGQDCIVVAK